MRLVCEITPRRPSSTLSPKNAATGKCAPTGGRSVGANCLVVNDNPTGFDMALNFQTVGHFLVVIGLGWTWRKAARLDAGFYFQAPAPLSGCDSGRPADQAAD